MTERFSGRKLRAARIKARISIETLSFRSGIDSRIISELESGVRRPRAAMQMVLADALGVRLQAFYSEDVTE
ncbi:MAG: helix-turn-helix domain-containing protein [Actinomycetota bacterium]|nr:helix-turn-helix domain-containing protein [Actinomycetota bacterium]